MAIRDDDRRPLAASMVVIGDEILSGFVTDTNTRVLAEALREHGVDVERVHTVPDTLDAIAEALHAERDRGGPRVVVTSGGIGSTPDDLTYEAVAAAFGRDVVEDPTLTERIDGAVRWTAAQGFPVDDDFRWNMMRMARIPAGATLLDRDGSWAPGVRLDLDGGAGEDGTSVCVLPGVPSQFRAIVTNAVVPQLVAGRNPVPVVRELTHGYPESTLNAVFAVLVREHPGVKLGSYPGDPMLVRLSGPADEVEAAATLVQAHLERLDATEHGQRIHRAWAVRTGRAPADDGSDSSSSDDDDSDDEQA